MAKDPEELKRIAKATEEAFRRVGTEIGRTMKSAEDLVTGTSGAFSKEFIQNADKMWSEYRKKGGESTAAAAKYIEQNKTAFRTLAAVMPSFFGKSGKEAKKVLEATADSASIIDSQYIANSRANMAFLTKIYRDAGFSRKESNERAARSIASGEISSVIGHYGRMQQMAAAAKVSTKHRAVFEKQGQREIEAIRKHGLDAGIKAQTELEKEEARAAVARMSRGATEVSQGRGILGSIARMIPAVQARAKEEKAVAEEVSRGNLAAAHGQSVWKDMGSEALSSLNKTLGGITPFVMAVGALGTVISSIISAFDGSRKAGGEMLSAISAQTPIAGKGLSSLDMGLQVLDRRLQTQRFQFAMAGQDVNEFSMRSLGLLKTVGGLGEGVEQSAVTMAEMTRELNEIQVLAPLAGMSMDQAMSLMGRGIRSFGLMGRGELTEFFEDFDKSRRKASLGAQDFLEAMGGIEDLEVVWGQSAKNIVTSMGDMVKGMGATTTEQMALIKGFSGLTRLPIAKTLAIHMAGGASLSQAMSTMQRSAGPGGNPMVAMVTGFRSMMDKQFKGGKASDLERGLFMERMLSEAGFAPLAKRAAFDPSFMKTMLTGNPEKTAKEMQKAMDLESGLTYARSQLGIMEAISKTISNLAQFLIRAPVLGMGGMSQDVFGRRMRAMEQTGQSAGRIAAASLSSQSNR